ncbi:heavy-metal-associated domain-containing protein [Wenyingzhuangia sp. IMCC45574]
MKLLKYIVVAVLAINTVACKPAAEKKTEAVEANLPKALVTSKVNIEGMTCEIGCAKTIESKISKLEGVTESKVDFEAKKGIFTYDSNKTSEEKIINTINGLIDGKTYKASHEDLKKGCSKECAEKCGHKEGEPCKKACEKKCEGTAKEECKSANKEKPCCAAKK